MTTYEHAMLGGTLALALGCQRRYGWGLVAAAGLAGTLPDWDGLTFVFSDLAFSRTHRVWGHNLLVAGCTGILVGGLGYLCQFSAGTHRRLARWNKLPDAPPFSPPNFRQIDLAEWLVVCLLASISHLFADIVFSGGAGLANWAVKLFWPFSDREWVWPLVAWGDPTTSIIFIVEMFAIYRWPKRAQSLAYLTLLAVLGYIGIRWLLGGV